MSRSDGGGVVRALAAASLPRRAEWQGPPTVEAVDRARRGVRDALRDWAVREDVVDDAVLVVAELLANVVEHARTPFSLVVETRGRLLHVAVSDHAVVAPPARDHPVAGEFSGLRLVTAVAARWGWDDLSAGKTVWAEFLV